LHELADGAGARSARRVTDYQTSIDRDERVVDSRDRTVQIVPRPLIDAILRIDRAVVPRRARLCRDLQLAEVSESRCDVVGHCGKCPRWIVPVASNWPPGAERARNERLRGYRSLGRTGAVRRIWISDREVLTSCNQQRERWNEFSHVVSPGRHQKLISTLVVNVL